MESFLKENNIEFETDVLLKHKTWIHQGGQCSLWVLPHSAEQLSAVVKHAWTLGMPFDIVGHTSNIAYSSQSNRQMVISTLKMKSYSIDGNTITCQAGAPVAKLAKECVAKGIKGFSGLVGLPGTIGAAVVNNSGCFNCAISEVMHSIDILLSDGSIATMTAADLQYSHRTSVLKRKEITGVVLTVRLNADYNTTIEEENRLAERAIRLRRETQEPPAGTLGSVYSIRIDRPCWRNKILKCIENCAMAVMPKLKAIKLVKKATLKIYGYSHIDRYVSDKKLNTFIWKDADAEEAFKQYKEFMEKKYSPLHIEIEER